MAAVARFLGLSTANDMKQTKATLDRTKDQLGNLETRVTAVPASSIATTHYRPVTKVF
jgi:hypothetical protein